MIQWSGLFGRHASQRWSHTNACALIQVDDSQLEGLRTHFSQFDVDNSGYIDSDELTAVLRSMGFNPTEKRISEVLSAYDTDRNGNLSFGEFVEVLFPFCLYLDSRSSQSWRAWDTVQCATLSSQQVSSPPKCSRFGPTTARRRKMRER